MDVYFHHNVRKGFVEMAVQLVPYLGRPVAVQGIQINVDGAAGRQVSHGLGQVHQLIRHGFQMLIFISCVSRHQFFSVLVDAFHQEHLIFPVHVHADFRVDLHINAAVGGGGTLEQHGEHQDKAGRRCRQGRRHPRYGDSGLRFPHQHDFV